MIFVPLIFTMQKEPEFDHVIQTFFPNKTVLWNVRALLTPHMCSLTPREVRLLYNETKLSSRKTEIRGL